VSSFDCERSEGPFGRGLPWDEQRPSVLVPVASVSVARIHDRGRPSLAAELGDSFTLVSRSIP
jgi:hypothetical protein